MKIPKKYRQMTRSIEVAPPTKGKTAHWFRVRGVHLSGEQFSHASPDKRRMWSMLERDVLTRLQKRKNMRDHDMDWLKSQGIQGAYGKTPGDAERGRS